MILNEINELIENLKPSNYSGKTQKMIIKLLFKS